MSSSAIPHPEDMSTDQLIEEVEALRFKLSEIATLPIHITERFNLNLSRSLQRLFAILYNNKGKGLSKISLHEALYDREPETDVILVNVSICSLRAKLKQANSQFEIKTIWGVGYYMIDTTEPQPELEL